MNNFSTLFKSESDLFVTLLGTGFSAVLGLIFFIMVSRSLGPDNLGILTAVIAVSVLIADITDLGISAGLSKFVAKYDEQRKLNIVGRFLTLSLVFKMVLVTLVVLVGIGFAKPLSEIIFQNQVSPAILSLGLLGAIVTAFFGFANFALQARRKFILFSVFNGFGNLSRLAVLGIVVIVSVIDVEMTLKIYLLGLLITGILSIIFLPVNLLRYIPTRVEVTEFFHFNKWLALGVIMFAIFTRLDSILLLSINNAFEAGLYAISTRITFILPLIAASLAAVWSPRFSAFETKDQAFFFFKKTIIVSAIFGFIAILPIPIGSFIINFMFGSQYAGAISSLNILFIGWALFLLAIPPIQLITYFFGKSNLFAFITLLQFLTIIILDFALIPSYGAYGAALAFMVGNFVALIFAYGLAFYQSAKDE